MLENKKYQVILFIVFAMFLSACTISNEEKQPTSENKESVNKSVENTAENTVADEQKSEDAGVCENKYYPVDTKANRNYKITGTASATYVLSQEKDKEDSFTENRKYSSGTDIKTNWLCTEDGLRNVEYNSSANFSSGNFKMETLESSGLTLPKTWEVGKKWTAEYKISGKLNAGPAKANANGTVKITNEIASLDDNITTSAGDFEAAKVNSTININLNIGRPMKITMTNWYAPDVGLVKQEVSSPFGGDEKVEYTGEK